MSHSQYRSIASDSEYADAAARSHHEAVLIYKHSSLCELCTEAKGEMLRLTRPGDPPVYEVVVQTARPLSSMIENALSIRHESPQAILLSNGQPVFHASHRGVTAKSVRSAMDQLP